MSKQLVIVEENPSGAPHMAESLVQQGHKFCLAYIREDGRADTEPKMYHLTPEMLKDAVMPEKKAPVKKVAEPKAPVKKAATKKK